MGDDSDFNDMIKHLDSELIKIPVSSLRQWTNVRGVCGSQLMYLKNQMRTFGYLDDGTQGYITVNAESRDSEVFNLVNGAHRTAALKELVAEEHFDQDMKIRVKCIFGGTRSMFVTAALRMNKVDGMRVAESAFDKICGIEAVALANPEGWAEMRLQTQDVQCLWFHNISMGIDAHRDMEKGGAKWKLRAEVKEKLTKGSNAVANNGNKLWVGMLAKFMGEAVGVYNNLKELNERNTITELGIRTSPTISWMHETVLNKHSLLRLAGAGRVANSFLLRLINGRGKNETPAKPGKLCNILVFLLRSYLRNIAAGVDPLGSVAWLTEQWLLLNTALSQQELLLTEAQLPDTTQLSDAHQTDLADMQNGQTYDDQLRTVKLTVVPKNGSTEREKSTAFCSVMSRIR